MPGGWADRQTGWGGDVAHRLGVGYPASLVRFSTLTSDPEAKTSIRRVPAGYESQPEKGRDLSKARPLFLFSGATAYRFTGRWR